MPEIKEQRLFNFPLLEEENQKKKKEEGNFNLSPENSTIKLALKRIYCQPKRKVWFIFQDIVFWFYKPSAYYN